ncbi:arginine deiminase [Aerococcus sanguinicola]|uniref:Arginine deiminase n=1 Tax=Aerococcus sanguinicola TaxID=119206 RepID=A0A0X8F9M3_9LACT|nr:arginine deiminase [Aerococcus sanguinicola]AMB93314.1 arginine deiminase [Aerococcus sanguinicola]PKZ23080.1 arginine deiminase [Aerococcus sanguinicola]
MTHPINVFSEIGRLKTVLVHRPGKELENLVPDYLDRLLFDDIPYLEEAQKEHDNFVKVMEDFGVEVVYLERLAAEAIDAADVKEQFVDEWLSETGLEAGAAWDAIRSDLLSYDDTFEMVLKTMEGYKKIDVDLGEAVSLDDLVDSEYPFLVDPMPNLYFTRDPFATMSHGVTINHMYSDTRNRETLYGKYIFTYHPTYGGDAVPRYYDREERTRIEGGDELVLSPTTLAVGISQRTGAASIEKLARRLFKETDYKEVLAFSIANNRKFMHLDTVFTMVDYDKFTIHPEIEGDLTVYSITPDGDDVKIEERVDELENILQDALGVEEVTLIRCGGDDIVASAREQWNDGSNTLTLAPGEVLVYDRNTVTNKLLQEHGIKLHEVRGSELVRGRGGPRCMSMPLYREDI